MYKLAIVASHPIQYQVPWFRRLAERTDLTVFFCHRQTADGQAGAGYGEKFEWDVPLASGYRAVWLRNVARTPNVFRFSGCDTPEVGAQLDRGHFDACIVSGWYLKSYLQAIVACRRRGIPVLLRGDSQLAATRSTLTKAVKYVPYRLLLNGVAGHLHVGESNRRYLAHYGVTRDRLFFVPHSIDDEWFSTQAADARASGDADRARREAGVDPRASMMLFVGRLVDQKRPLDFVDAVVRASASRRMVGVIAGSGPLGDAVRARVRDTGAPIQLVGFRNQSMLPLLYAGAQALVLPSDGRETWGLVVNEAMACGVPAVVSDAAGCVVDLIGAHTGRAYPLGNVGALAEAMIEVDALQRAHGETVRAALAEVTQRFCAAAAADATVVAIADVAHRRKTASGTRRASAWI